MPRPGADKSPAVGLSSRGGSFGLSGAGSESSEHSGIRLLSRRGISPDPLAALVNAEKVCVPQLPGTERSSGDVLGSPGRLSCIPQHLWFLSDLNWGLRGGRKRPWESSALVCSPSDPTAVAGDSRPPKVARGTGAVSKARSGEVSGEGLGGALGCGVEHVEMPKDTPNGCVAPRAGSRINALLQGDFAGVCLQSERRGGQLVVPRQQAPLPLPHTSPFLPPATARWGQRGCGNTCTHREPKPWVNPSH